jgi:hypothetical protein
MRSPPNLPGGARTHEKTPGDCWSREWRPSYGRVPRSASHRHRSGYQPPQAQPGRHPLRMLRKPSKSRPRRSPRMPGRRGASGHDARSAGSHTPAREGDDGDFELAQGEGFHPLDQRRLSALHEVAADIGIEDVHQRSERSWGGGSSPVWNSGGNTSDGSAKNRSQPPEASGRRIKASPCRSIVTVSASRLSSTGIRTAWFRPLRKILAITGAISPSLAYAGSIGRRSKSVKESLTVDERPAVVRSYPSNKMQDTSDETSGTSNEDICRVNEDPGTSASTTPFAGLQRLDVSAAGTASRMGSALVPIRRRASL